MSSPAQAKVTGNGVGATAGPRPAAEARAPPSAPTVIVLVAAACGMGVLCGFMLFYLTYRTQCAHLLTTKSFEFNSTMDRIQSLDDKKHIERQKHLLSQQSALTERHQNLLEKLAESQTDHEMTKRLLQQELDKVKMMTDTIQQAEAAVAETNAVATKKAERLQRQLDLAKIMLQEKVDEVEVLKTNAADDTTQSSTTNGLRAATFDSNNDAYFQLQSAVRRQNSVQLGLLYGQPPYMVHMYLKSPNMSSFPVEVQITAVGEMPHVIHSFLSLVKAGAFLETTLSKHDGKSNMGRLIGGSPASTLRKQVQSKLTRLYAEQGYSSTGPLLFPELSSKPCRPGSLGWIRHGPSLVVHVTPNAEADDDFTCFGRIVSGLDSLERFMTSSSSSSDERLSIVDARIVAAAATAHHEEL